MNMEFNFNNIEREKNCVSEQLKNQHKKNHQNDNANKKKVILNFFVNFNDCGNNNQALSCSTLNNY